MAFMAAALTLAIFYVLAFRWIHPEFPPFMGHEAAKLIAPGKDLIPISVGKYRVTGANAIIEDFNGEEAILVLHRSFQAEDYPFIKVNLSGFTRYSKSKILWQQAGNPTTHALEFNRSGDELTQISMVAGGEAYKGSITSLALLFYDGPALGFKNNNNVDIVIQSIELRPFSTWRIAEQIFEDWTNPPLWQGHSNNVVRGIHANGMLLPNSAANLLVVTGFLISVLCRFGRRNKPPITQEHHLFATTLCLCVYGWMFNDVWRWQWRVEQLLDAHSRYSGLQLEERILNSDILCARFPNDCKTTSITH